MEGQCILLAVVSKRAKEENLDYFKIISNIICRFLANSAKN